MLVSEAIDRTFNRWLYPAGINRPSFDTLASNITDVATSIPTNQRITIPRDSILEIASELILTSDSVAGVITAAERGYLDTDKAAHSSGDRVYLDPMFARKLVFDTIKDVINELYPMGIYQRVIDDTLSWTETDAAISLPSGTKRLLKATVVRAYTTPTQYFPLRGERGDYEILYEFEPPKLVLRWGGYDDAQIIVVVAKDFVAPTTEADDLTSVCKVPASLAPHIPMAVAGNILSTREIPRVVVEEVRRLLSTQGIQVGAALNVGQVLINLFAQKVEAERRRLAQVDRLTFEME